MNNDAVEKVARALIGQHIVGMDYAREVAAQCIKAYEEALVEWLDDELLIVDARTTRAHPAYKSGRKKALQDVKVRLSNQTKETEE